MSRLISCENKRTIARIGTLAAKKERPIAVLGGSAIGETQIRGVWGKLRAGIPPAVGDQDGSMELDSSAIKTSSHPATFQLLVYSLSSINASLLIFGENLVGPVLCLANTYGTIKSRYA
jgi:hypothetical protein